MTVQYTAVKSMQ